jgi:hypothetical protein
VQPTDTPPSTAQPPATHRAAAPFADGERLLYNVSYRAALIPSINVLRVSISTVEERVGGRDHYHIVGHGATVGGAATIFDIDDTYHSWLDGATLLPSRTASEIRENDYRLSSNYSYDWNAMRATAWSRRSDRRGDRRASFALPGRESGDALTLLYRLRALDPRGLIEGRACCLSLVVAEGTKPIEYRFEGREEVTVRRLGTFRALRFSCTMATADGSTFEEGMRFTAWLSDDENRIPLIVESPVRVGRVRVTLAEGFRTLHPLTPRVE